MLLNRSTFFVRERVGLLKLVDTYDILDPASRETIGLAREEQSFVMKLLRLLVNKQLLPTRVHVCEREGEPPVFSIVRGFTLLRAKVEVVKPDGRCFGYFKSKLFSLGGGFHVFDPHDRKIAEVKGDWKGWNFKFLDEGGREIGTVTKQWAGLGKELFTTADNYIISLRESEKPNEETTALLLAAGLAIDIVFKENG